MNDENIPNFFYAIVAGICRLKLLVQRRFAVYGPWQFFRTKKLSGRTNTWLTAIFELQNFFKKP
jgi:hypothetical protein